jgi:hypothetical protein
MLRVLQCVAPDGRLSNVCTMTLSTLASPILRGTPGRGSSSSPSRPHSTKRRGHFPTVCAVTRSRTAIALLLSPAAQPNTMRASNANACAVLRRWRVALQDAGDLRRQFNLGDRTTRSQPHPPMAYPARKLLHEFPARYTGPSFHNASPKCLNNAPHQFFTVTEDAFGMACSRCRLPGSASAASTGRPSIVIARSF